MLPKSRFRVSRHTADRLNEDIRRRMKANIEYYSQAGPAAIDARLKELDGEWDIERTLEANAAFFSLLGLFLGKTVNRRFYLLTAGVAGFLMQHALQGWFPPLPILRRRGIRTTEEIEAERTALKLIRGDFRSAAESQGDRPLDADILLNAVGAERYFHAGKAEKSEALKRDISGECEEECRDRAREGEEERQAAIDKVHIEPEDYPRAPGAEKRSEQPGVYGGHV